MRVRWMLGALAIACGAGFVTGRAFTDEGDKKGGDAASKQKAWAALNQIGEPHRRLAELAGTWAVRAKVRDNATGTFVESDGTAEFTPILGGRFVRHDLKGKMMGDAYEGVGYLGFEVATGTYVATWLDNLGTGWEVGTGVEDAAKKTITYSMTMHGPGGVEVKTRDVLIRRSDKQFTWQNYASIDGPERMWMELEYTKP
jgi:hypothetical protein